MDNGQTNYSYPTEGVGNTDKGINPDAENSLNAEAFFDTEKSGPIETASYDPSKMGNVAINGELVERPEEPEISNVEVEFAAPEMPKSPFEVVETERAPAETSVEASNIVDFNTLKVDKNDRLPSIARKALNKGLRQFENNEISPANLVDLRWAASKAYLKDSFNRDIGEAA